MASKAGGPNLVRRIIDIPAANAAAPFINITATGPARGWRIEESILSAEDVALSAEGFRVKIPNDGSAAGFTTVFGRPAYSSANEPGTFPFFENWNHISEHGPFGEVFAGPGNATPGSGIGATNATVLCQIGSLTNTATSIEIVEYF